MNVYKRLTATLVFAALSVFTIGPSAYSNEIGLTFPSGTSQFSSGSFQSVATTTGVTPAISGGTADADLRVTVDATNSGLLRLDTTTGVTASDTYTLTDFNSGSNGLAVISFVGKQADVSSALGSLEFKKLAVGDSVISVSVSEGTGLVVGNSYYQVVTASGGIDWLDASKAALATSIPSTVDGTSCQGYLTTVTSADEQAAIYEKVGTSSWIGGSDQLSFVNHAIDFVNNNDSGSATFSAQDDDGDGNVIEHVEGKFFWVFGPERGQQISLDNSDGSVLDTIPDGYPGTGFQVGRDINKDLTSVDDPNLLVSPASAHVYQNWSDSVEPNDYNNGTPGEDAIQLFANGTWNDLPTTGSTLTQYIVEYGGLVATDGFQSDAANVNLETLSHVGEIGECIPAVVQSTKTASFTADVDTLPGSPTGVSATSAEGETTVSWTAPGSDGGSSVTGYKIEISVDGGAYSVKTADTSSSSTSIVYSDLIAESSYTFKVSAINAIGTSTASSESSAVTHTVAPDAPPYDGPIITNLSMKMMIEDTEVSLLVSGIRLDRVTGITVDEKDASFSNQTESQLLVHFPKLEPGIKDLKISWGSGLVTHVRALDVRESEPESISVTEKLNAGSFKGYVALYAKGYEGHRLSAKVGKDWVIVDALESDFERIVEYTGVGYQILVRMYVDSEWIKTVPLTTK